MPWLDSVPAVLQAWYPGARGGEAIASVLFGETNPSGRLPVTFPASLDQLPRPVLDGSDWVEPDVIGSPVDGRDQLHADYDIEGSDVGYRWFSRKNFKPLFPFGFGLSYTSFTATNFKVSGRQAVVTVSNTGQRLGDEVVQIYLTSRNGKPMKRLLGFDRIRLKPGETRSISIALDPRVLADWDNGRWVVPAGSFSIAVGRNAEEMSGMVTVRYAREILR